MDFLCSFAVAPGKVVRFCTFDLGFPDLDLDLEHQLTDFALICILALFVYVLVCFFRQARGLVQIAQLLLSIPVYVRVIMIFDYKFVALWRPLNAVRRFLADNPAYLWATPLVCGLLYLGGLCLVVLGQSVLLLVSYCGVRLCLLFARLALGIYGGLRTLAATLSETKTLAQRLFSGLRALAQSALAGVRTQVSHLACAIALFWHSVLSVLESLSRCVCSGLRPLNPLAAEVDAQAAVILALQAIIADQKAAIVDQEAELAYQNAVLLDKDAALADKDAALADKEAAFDDASVLLRMSNASFEAANSSLEVANASIVEKDNVIQELTATLNGAYTLSAQREMAMRAKCLAVEELEISLQDKVETIENMAESLQILNTSLAGARAEAARYKRISDDLQRIVKEKQAENALVRDAFQDVIVSNTQKDDVIDEQTAKMRRMALQYEEKTRQIADLESTITELHAKLHDAQLIKKEQEAQLEAKIDTIDGLKEKIVTLETQVDQSKLKALRVERAHRKEIEDALKVQLELQALVTSLQSAASRQAQALEQKNRLIVTREDEIAVMSASYNAAVESHTEFKKKYAKQASAPTSTKAEAAVDTADLPTPDAAILAHTLEQNKALAAQLLHMDAEHTEQITKARTDLAHARTAVLAHRGELDNRDSEIFDLKQQLLDARSHSRDTTSILQAGNSSRGDVFSTNMKECRDVVVPELPMSLSWTGAHFSSPRQSTGELGVADTFVDLLEAMSTVHPIEIDAQLEPLPSLGRTSTPSVTPAPDASSSFDFKQYLGNMSCELLHDHLSFISQDQDSFWLKDSDANTDMIIDANANANTDVNTDAAASTKDVPESIQSSSSLDSAFWGQEGTGSCDLLRDHIPLGDGDGDDSFWMQSTDSIPAMLEASEKDQPHREPEVPDLPTSESTSSLDNSFWHREPSFNLLVDDVSMGGDDDSFWLKSEDEASESGAEEEFLTPASSSCESFASCSPLEPEPESEVESEAEADESFCEDVTFRAPLEEDADDLKQPAKAPASPQRGRSSRVKALKDLEQFVDLPSPLAAPFELPTTSLGDDASSTPTSMAKRAERLTAPTTVGLSA